MNDDPGAVQQRIQESLRLRKLIGNYEIVRKVGEGSFSSVYLAVHVMTRHEVVLKSADKSQANLSAEIANMSLLSHPHIVRLYEYIVMPDKMWLVLEYCGGEELLSFLVKSADLPVSMVCRLFSQLVGAVAYAHQLHCAHRDLKLENVLLDEQGNIKLGDFGFTRSYLPRTFLETVCGTESYMAPELLLRKKYLPEAADAWSLGVILYALLYGRLPFDEDNAALSLQRVVEEDPPFPAVAGREFLIAIAQKLLLKNPHKRPRVIDVLNELREDGKLQKQIITKISSHPQSAPLFSSTEERTVLKAMKALNVDLHIMASSVVHHKCDPLHGLWYTALDRQRMLKKDLPDTSTGSAVSRARSWASIPSKRSHARLSRSVSRSRRNSWASSMHASTATTSSHPATPTLPPSTLQTPILQVPTLQANSLLAGVLPSDSQSHYSTGGSLSPQPLTSYELDNDDYDDYDNRYEVETASIAPTSSTVPTEGSERKGKFGFKKSGTMDRIISALKINKRAVPKDTLLNYYKPSLEQATASSRLLNALPSHYTRDVFNIPRESTPPVSAPLRCSTPPPLRKPHTPVLDLSKSPTTSRRQSVLSIGSSISLPLGDFTPASKSVPVPFSMQVIPNNTQPRSQSGSRANNQNQSQSSLLLQQSQNSLGPQTYQPSLTHTQTFLVPMLGPTMSRPMSTYSQVSQISQLSQSSVETSKLLADANNSFPGAPVGPTTSHGDPSTPLMHTRRSNSLTKRFTGMAPAALSTSTPPGTPVTRQRARLTSLKKIMPYKIEEGVAESDFE